MSPRRSALLVAALTAVTLLGVPSVAMAGTPPWTGYPDPSGNTAPSAAFIYACHNIDDSSQSNQDTCDAAAATEFSSAWATEGITATFTLPTGFDTMSVPDQIVAITDVERAARGLTAVTGRASSLDALAQDAADNDADPDFPSPFPGDFGGSNWAGAGNSVLLDDFYWMYDDGVGSPNADCVIATDSGCWGHRHNVVYDYDAPLMMGAAVAYNTTYGTSITELFIGDDTTDAPTSTSPASPSLAVSKTSMTVRTKPLGTATATVTSTAAGGSIPVSATITSGVAMWNVSPATCTATPAKPCVFTVTFNPTRPGNHGGQLSLASSAGNHVISLNGFQPQPDLWEGFGSFNLRRGQHEPMSATVVYGSAHHRIAHARVVLLTRKAGTHSWHHLAVRHTNSRGVAKFNPVPKHARTVYKLVVTSRTGAVEIAGSPVVIRVA